MFLIKNFKLLKQDNYDIIKGNTDKFITIIKDFNAPLSLIQRTTISKDST